MRISFFILFLFFLFQGSAIAAKAIVDCQRTKLMVKQIKLPSVNISVGNDLPNGSVIYSGLITNENDSINSSSPGTHIISCSSRNTSVNPSTGVIERFSFLNTTSVNNIYPTNRPGIGVRFKFPSDTPLNGGLILSGNKAISSRQKFPPSPCHLTGNQNRCYFNEGLTYRFDLIKTGVITAGAINGASFPTIIKRMEMNNITGQINGFPMRVGEVTFYGSMNITVPTCTVKNVFVDFQKISIHEISKNNNSKWFDSSITLTNCPVFYGYSGNSINKWSYNSAGTISSSSSTNNNMISYKITPVSSIYDNQNGIINIDNITNKAKGIGVQISKGNASNNSILNFTNSYSISAPKNGQSTIRIPLVSRVVKLNDNLASGLINAQVVFTINYQ
ncbi:type 1 fimbrial protein [Providencia rettgeri]